MFRMLARRSLLTAVLVLLPLLSTLTATLTPAAAAVACADLIITDITINPSSPVVNQTADIYVTVKNQGTCTSTAFVVQWKSDQLAPTGPSSSVASLGAGADTTLHFTYAFPNVGNFLTSAMADTANAVPESVENNNLAIKSVTVQAATTDLVITDVTFTPDPAVQTDAMHVNIHVVNQGNTAAGSFRVTWLPGLFQPLQSQQISSLGPGAAIDVGFNYTYWLPGTNLTIATVDAYGEVAETNEFNNTVFKNLTVDPPLPDLHIKNVSINPPVPIAGQPATLTATVENIGHRPAGPFQVQWQPWFFAWPMQIQVNGPIPVGGTQDVTFNYTYPWAGTFDGTITVDPNNWVWELKEDNNSNAYQVTVGASTVDLTITDFHYAPANPVQGEDTTFSVTIKNQGNTTAKNFVVSVNPQAFGIESPGPSTLTTNVSSLGPGASQTLTFHYQYPVHGNFRAIAQVDAFNNVAETNEENNTALANLVVSPTNIDLRIDSFVLTTDLCAQAVPNGCSPMKFWTGSTVTAAITVHNYGTYPADSFSVEWLLHDTDGFGPIETLPGLLPGQSQTVYLHSTYPDTGTVTTKAIVDVFNQVIEPCAGCETNNTATRSITLRPRDVTLTVTLTNVHVYANLDCSGIGCDPNHTWSSAFAVLDPSASCTVGDTTIELIWCTLFDMNDVGDNSDNYVNKSHAVTLPEGIPVVAAFGALDIDLFGADFAGYAYGVWFPPFPATAMMQGQGADSCGGRCFDAYLSFNVTNAPPPPSQVGTGSPTSLTVEQQSVVNNFVNAVKSSAP